MADNNTIPKDSQIKKSGFNNFMSRLFGWQRRNSNSSESKTTSGMSGIDFTKVDVGSDQRVGQALVNELLNTQGPLNEKLDSLFNRWLTDNSDKYTELYKRKDRIDQLSYAVLNDPYIGRTVQLYADEACQLDEQNTILNIETPDPRMTRDMYKLINQWGITQTRIRSTIENLATYGDAFWANKISERGVERIIPLQQLQVTDRVEFNPIKVLEMKKRKEGSFGAMANNNYLIQQMLDQMNDTGEFADMFDSKLFGFEIDSDMVVPPWAITHFRMGGDLSQFYPFGTSPILGALAPFKQTASTIALQSLSRILSFPISLYKVKTSDAMTASDQFNLVNTIRQEYDNIGVSPQAGTSEVYTVNTKIWLPDGLLSVEVVKPDIDTGNVDDLKIYQDRTAVAVGIPKGFFSDDGWYSFGQSGQSLIQQYKPFARAVYSVQSAFLEGLADLFRIHFAITGMYDFRVPFTLSMKFPAVEVTSDRNDARNGSIEIANNVVDLIKAAVGASEDDPLPPDIIRDIIGKYTFLDPEDIMKWTRDAKFIYDISGDDDDEGSSSLSGSIGSRIDLDTDEPEETFTPEVLETSEPVEEALKNYEKIYKKMSVSRLNESSYRNNYKEKKDEIYFEILESTATNAFVRDGQHVAVFNQVPSVNELMLETLNSNGSREDGTSRLSEGFNGYGMGEDKVIDED